MRMDCSILPDSSNELLERSWIWLETMNDRLWEKRAIALRRLTDVGAHVKDVHRVI